MPKQPKRWMVSPARPTQATTKVPEAVKAAVQAQANAWVETVLKPAHLKPPPDEPRFNYLVDIGTRWYGSAFYFYGTYACPGPYALSPSFEERFARLVYAGSDRFDLSFRRHTGQWIELYPGSSLNECLETIRDDALFQP